MLHKFKPIDFVEYVLNLSPSALHNTQLNIGAIWNSSDKEIHGTRNVPDNDFSYDRESHVQRMLPVSLERNLYKRKEQSVSDCAVPNVKFEALSITSVFLEMKLFSPFLNLSLKIIVKKPKLKAIMSEFKQSFAVLLSFYSHDVVAENKTKGMDCR